MKEKVTTYRMGRQTQARIIEFIERWQAENGYPPTLDEIAEAVGIGKSSVHYHVKRLERMGVVERTLGHNRSIKLVRT